MPSIKSWKAVSRETEKLPIITLLGISEFLKLRGKWKLALRVGQVALERARGQESLMEGMAMLSVGHSYRNQTPANWDAAQVHLASAKATIENQPPSRDQTFYLMRAVLLLGDTLVRREAPGDLAEAEILAQLSERLLQTSRDVTKLTKGRCWTLFTGRWGEFCVHSMVELGEIYYYTNRWAEGEKLLRELVPTLVKRRGKRHATTIEAQRDLASMLVNQDKYEEAEVAYRIAREWNEKVPVFGHEEKAAIDYNIALCLSERGDNKAAKEEIAKMDLPADLLHYANGEWTLKLARLTHVRLKEYEEVISLCRRFQLVLDEHVTKYGPTHPITLRNLEDHVLALKALRRWDEAIVVLRDMCRREATDITRTVEETLETRFNLANTLRYAGQYEEAAYEYRKCLEIERAATDEARDDAQVRNLLKYLAYLYELSGDKTNALIAYSQLQREYWGRPRHARNILKYEWCRGKMFMLQGRWANAATMFLGALSTRKAGSPDTLAIPSVPVTVVQSLDPVRQTGDTDVADVAELEVLQIHEVDTTTVVDVTTNKAAIGFQVVVQEVDDLSDSEEAGMSWDAVDWWWEVITDALDAVKREEVFQSHIPLDEVDSEVDEDEGLETVDSALTQESDYPVVPMANEWRQPQFPKLPDSYEELVKQIRRSVEENRHWDP